MPFGDPLVGGNTLIRDAIQSQDYVTGVSGWAIMADGSAEFNNIVINGGGAVGRVVIDGGVITVYNSSNQVITRIDGDGLALGPNLADPTSAILTLSPSNPEISFKPGDDGGFTYEIAGILASDKGSPNYNGTFQLFSPRRSIAFDPQTFVTLVSGLASGTVPSSLDIVTQQITLGGSRVWVLAQQDELDATGALTLTATATLIPGCTVTYTGVPAGSRWKATLSVDCNTGATGGITNVGQLYVQLNGGAVTHQTGDINTSVVSSRVPGSRTWGGIFTAGGTIHLEARGAGGGSNQYLNPHTTLLVEIFE